MYSIHWQSNIHQYITKFAHSVIFFVLCITQIYAIPNSILKIYVMDSFVCFTVSPSFRSLFNSPVVLVSFFCCSLRHVFHLIFCSSCVFFFLYLTAYLPFQMFSFFFLIFFLCVSVVCHQIYFAITSEPHLKCLD